MAANLANASIKSTGGATSRTFGDRFAVIKDVTDFGAIGDGSHDDSDNIQAAIDWQTATGDRGVIFFPAGTYKTTKALTFDYTAAHSIIFRGVGEASKLQANFAGYVIDRSVTGFGNPALDIIEDLWIENASTNSAAGGIRWNSAENLTIRNCRINAYTGIGLFDSTFNVTIYNILMSNPGSGSALPNSVGINSQCNGAKIYSCDIIGFGDGVRLGVGANVANCRFENCANGLNLGTAAAGGTQGIGSATILTCGFEACDVAIWARAINYCVIAGCGINGHGGMTPDLSGYGAGGSGRGDGWSTYGIVTGVGSNNVWMAINVLADGATVSYVADAVKIGDGTQARNTWICVEVNNGGAAPGGSTSKWNIATGTSGLSFLRCSPDIVPLISVVTVANLPSSPVLGMTYTVSDSTSVSVGSSVTTGGNSNKYLVWHNGTNWIRVV